MNKQEIIKILEDIINNKSIGTNYIDGTEVFIELSKKGLDIVERQKFHGRTGMTLTYKSGDSYITEQQNFYY